MEIDFDFVCFVADLSTVCRSCIAITTFAIKLLRIRIPNDVQSTTRDAKSKSIFPNFIINVTFQSTSINKKNKPKLPVMVAIFRKEE